jgi:transposase
MSKAKNPTPAGNQRRRFDPAFKREAVELGRRIGIVQAAADIGIGESNLRNWTKAVEAQGGQAFLPVSQRTDVEVELRRLREEVRVLKMEREILKKATAFFAKGDA